MPDAAAQQKGNQQVEAHTTHSILPQQAGHSLKQPAQQPAQQMAQQPTASLDDQILEIMEEYDEAVHGPLQKAVPEHVASTQHPDQTLQPSSPISSSVMKSSPASPITLPAGAVTLPAGAITLPASASPDDQRHQHRLSAAPSMQANTHATPVAADNSNAMTATRKHNSEHPDQQLMQQQQLRQPQHMHPQQDTLKRDPQQQQEQACTQDDKEFELMMARFDELAQQEAATPTGAALLCHVQ